MEKSDNELIAEFMGLKRREPGEYYAVSYWDEKDKRGLGDFVGYYDSLKYHISWDWLMPVVEKIEKLTKRSTAIKWSTRWGHSCQIWVKDEGGIYVDKGQSKISAVYKAVVAFIRSYNSQQYERK